jgi:hypothetical protein
MRKIFLAAACLAAFTAAAQAETLKFHATLDGASEVPAKTTDGKGLADVTLDTATGGITYTVTYAALTGDATMAHIHGPALPGANAGVIVVLAPPASPIKGSATLTADQVADLEAGKYYINVHTAKNPGGEIRGQLTAVK